MSRNCYCYAISIFHFLNSMLLATCCCCFEFFFYFGTGKSNFELCVGSLFLLLSVICNFCFNLTSLVFMFQWTLLVDFSLKLQFLFSFAVSILIAEMPHFTLFYYLKLYCGWHREPKSHHTSRHSRLWWKNLLSADIYHCGEPINCHVYPP